MFGAEFVIIYEKREGHWAGALKCGVGDGKIHGENEVFHVAEGDSNGWALTGPAPLTTACWKNTADDVRVGVTVGHVYYACDAIGAKILKGLALLGRSVGFGHLLAAGQRRQGEPAK
jgi:hypothetical protein